VTRPFVKGGIRPAKSFYDGIDGRRKVTCSDCGFPADALFGDHAGACEKKPTGPTPSPLDIIRKVASEREVLSMNECRAEFDLAGIKKTSRGRAFDTAQKARVIERIGSVPSTDPDTKSHRISSYRSLHPKFSRKALTP
jgi:hypothetical protein